MSVEFVDWPADYFRQLSVSVLIFTRAYHCRACALCYQGKEPTSFLLHRNNTRRGHAVNFDLSEHVILLGEHSSWATRFAGCRWLSTLDRWDANIRHSGIVAPRATGGSPSDMHVTDIPDIWATGH